MVSFLPECLLSISFLWLYNTYNLNPCTPSLCCGDRIDSNWITLKLTLQTRFLGASGHVQFDSSGQRSVVTLDIFQSIGILHTSSSSNIEDAAAVMVGSWSTSKGLLWAKVCIQMKLLCFCSLHLGLLMLSTMISSILVAKMILLKQRVRQDTLGQNRRQWHWAQFWWGRHQI